MARPLRFCFLTTFYPPGAFGGDAIYVKRLARALVERGHSVTVAHAAEAHRALRGSALGASAALNGVAVVPIDSGLGALSPLATYLSGRPLFTRRPIDRVLAAGFDVIHFHNPSLLGGPALLGMGSGVKLYTAHEQWLLCPTHTLWKYKREICERPQCWRCSLTYLRPPQLWRSTDLLERSISHLDALIVPSRTSERLHQRFAPHVRIERIAHFVPDVDEAAPPGSGSGHERPYFVFVGRLEPIKGVETLLAAFRGRPEDLLIAGTGSLEPALRREAAGLPNVHFLGWVEDDELDGLYRNALAAVVPTRGHESFGLVTVEALARGTPAIVRGVGALRELIEDSGGGLAYRTEQELETALDEIAASSALRNQLGQRGRAAYLERWTTEAHLGGYFRLIGEIAEGSGSGELAAAARSAAGALG